MEQQLVSFIKKIEDKSVISLYYIYTEPRKYRIGQYKEMYEKVKLEMFSQSEFFPKEHLIKLSYQGEKIKCYRDQDFKRVYEEREFAEKYFYENNERMAAYYLNFSSQIIARIVHERCAELYNEKLEPIKYVFDNILPFITLNSIMSNESVDEIASLSTEEYVRHLRDIAIQKRNLGNSSSITHMGNLAERSSGIAHKAQSGIVHQGNLAERSSGITHKTHSGIVHQGNLAEQSSGIAHKAQSGIVHQGNLAERSSNIAHKTHSGIVHQGNLAERSSGIAHKAQSGIVHQGNLAERSSGIAHKAQSGIAHKARKDIGMSLFSTKRSLQKNE